MAGTTDITEGGPQTPGGVLTRRAPAAPFEVHLEQFDGPFDLLLGLIGKHRLDVTEIALAAVTDEFVAHLRRQQQGGDWDLSEATEFLLVAATLLELKAARLLPRQEGDEEDLELIEARDLLFARLLQYRAFKEVAAVFDDRMGSVGRVMPRLAGLEARFAGLLPELRLGLTPEAFAQLSALAMMPKPVPAVGLAHLHAARVSMREEAVRVTTFLRERGAASFADIVGDAESTLVIATRFLVVLELFRDAAVTFDQPESLGPLMVSWTGDEETQERMAQRMSQEYDDGGATTPAGGGATGPTPAEARS